MSDRFINSCSIWPNVLVVSADIHGSLTTKRQITFTTMSTTNRTLVWIVEDLTTIRYHSSTRCQPWWDASNESSGKQQVSPATCKYYPTTSISRKVSRTWPSNKIKSNESWHPNHHLHSKPRTSTTAQKKTLHQTIYRSGYQPMRSRHEGTKKVPQRNEKQLSSTPSTSNNISSYYPSYPST